MLDGSVTIAQLPPDWGRSAEKTSSGVGKLVSDMSGKIKHELNCSLADDRKSTHCRGHMRMEIPSAIFHRSGTRSARLLTCRSVAFFIVFREASGNFSCTSTVLNFQPAKQRLHYCSFHCDRTDFRALLIHIPDRLRTSLLSSSSSGVVSDFTYSSFAPLKETFRIRVDRFPYMISIAAHGGSFTSALLDN